MSIEFPVETTSVINETKPSIPYSPSLELANVRMADGKGLNIKVTWSGAAISGIEAEWYWENGDWSDDGQTWTQGSRVVNHHIHNLLDPAFLEANPEAAVMVEVFPALVAISKRAKVI